MSKGEQTRQTILDNALALASEVGLEGVTIGTLAGEVGLSKSGLYAHFSSKEDLQCQILDAAAERFVDVVVAPALKQPRGLPRLRALVQNWLAWGRDALPGGCPFVAAAVEYDDRPGPVRDRVVRYQRDLLDTLAQATRLAVAEGHLSTDLDVPQFVFELEGVLFAYHTYHRLFRHPDAATFASRSFDQLVRAASGA